MDDSGRRTDFARMEQPANYAATLDRFTGFGAHYDGVRPLPPERLAALLLPMAGVGERAGLVVDLGSGTGLSSRYWARHARSVIGIEPTASMREQAEQFEGDNLSYRDGYAHDTGLASDSADIVSCAQSLHWMEPTSTFREAARVLRPGGLLAAYDYDWPPATPFWEADAAYVDCMEHTRALEKEHGLTSDLPQWDKPGHLGRMAASGCFRFTRECVLHHEDAGEAERFVGLMLSQGYIQTLLKRGLSEADLGVDRLREVARRCFGEGESPWFWSTRVRIGIK